MASSPVGEPLLEAVLARGGPSILRVYGAMDEPEPDVIDPHCRRLDRRSP
jgi:hypothetical protein